MCFWTFESQVENLNKKKNDLSLQFVPTLVLACFQLHNFCEYRNNYLDEEEVIRQIQSNNSEEALHKHLPDPVYSSTNAEGIAVRKILKTYVQQNLPEEYVQTNDINTLFDWTMFTAKAIFTLVTVYSKNKSTVRNNSNISRNHILFLKTLERRGNFSLNTVIWKKLYNVYYNFFHF